ncbi:MAG TPA: hypothetical protein VFS67_35500 [Polyangiaceae bacterium]|nr:hypothetical protein [Polyangiaceae bacterium]
MDLDPESPRGATLAAHRAWRQRRANAAYDAKSRHVDASGLNAHERELAADMTPAQRKKFEALCRESRARRNANAPKPTNIRKIPTP